MAQQPPPPPRQVVAPSSLLVPEMESGEGEQRGRKRRGDGSDAVNPSGGPEQQTDAGLFAFPNPKRPSSGGFLDGVGTGEGVNGAAAAPACGDSGGGTCAVAKLRPCRCKNSRCLKLYCECFQNKAFCSGCKCTNCMNTEDHIEDVLTAMSIAYDRNPCAFKPKVTPSPLVSCSPVASEPLAASVMLLGIPLTTGGVPTVSSPRPEPQQTTTTAAAATTPRQHNKGCHCRKTGCLKKYCECFQNSVRCGSSCRCAHCKNVDGGPELFDALMSVSGRRTRRTGRWSPPPCPPLVLPVPQQDMSAITEPPSAAEQQLLQHQAPQLRARHELAAADLYHARRDVAMECLNDSELRAFACGLVAAVQPESALPSSVVGMNDSSANASTMEALELGERKERVVLSRLCRFVQEVATRIASSAPRPIPAPALPPPVPPPGGFVPVVPVPAAPASYSPPQPATLLSSTEDLC